MNYSLRARALLVVSVVLAGFLGATGLVLDRAFRDSAEAALRDRLQGYVYTLLAGSEMDSRGILRGPETLHEPRFSQAGSGLYAEIRRGNRKPDWRSPSSVGVTLPRTPLPRMGGGTYTQTALEDGTALQILSFGVLWEEGRRKPVRYVFRVAETLEGYYAQVNQFRRSLWRWLGGAAVVLLVLQGLIFSWGFSPLRRVAADLRAIEAGRAERLTGRYPVELRGLTDNLNALLDAAESHLSRYRNALGDLAHSLKTPLAVLRGVLETEPPDAETRMVAREQIERMNHIVEYQLKRAAASGRTSLTPPVRIAEKARQIASALTKVYAEKGIHCHIRIAPDLRFHGDEGDLLEILGNLADNAFKWGRSQVAVSAHRIAGGGLELRVEDDGPGVPTETAQRILGRGERADVSVPGHGLGLAIVHSIVHAYGGTLVFETSPLGGAAVIIRALG